MAEDKRANRWNPGMRSDSEPQPKYDSDFGPAYGYGPNDPEQEAKQADEIRQEWIETERQEHPERGIEQPRDDEAA